ncbi:hypothetical protein D9613_004499 [Agrocybe pediades]|uniref:Uncharacterized protein n=1 Tax=Agrocybe pediades TaxID=84607 RepID=A0A8H4QI55_9AGAR|nr:hypothetical protein D9613_004499 [Agrocybe pediades]
MGLPLHMRLSDYAHDRNISHQDNQSQDPDACPSRASKVKKPRYTKLTMMRPPPWGASSTLNRKRRLHQPFKDPPFQPTQMSGQRTGTSSSSYPNHGVYNHAQQVPQSGRLLREVGYPPYVGGDRSRPKRCLIPCGCGYRIPAFALISNF